MYIKIIKGSQNKQYIQVVESYRDDEGKVKHRVIKNYGNLKDRVKEDPNFLDNLKQSLNRETLSINIDLGNKNDTMLENYGYLLIDKYLKEIGIYSYIKDKFLDDYSNIYNCLLCAVIQKIYYGNFSFKEMTNDNYFNFKIPSTEAIEKSISILYDEKEGILKKVIRELKGISNLDHVFCSIVPFYSDIDTNHHTNEIEHSLSLSLFTDGNDIPLYYKSQNNSSKNLGYYRDVINLAKDDLGSNNIVLVANKEFRDNFSVEYRFHESDNNYILGSNINSHLHVFSSIASNMEDYKLIPNKKLWYQVRNVYKIVTIRALSGIIRQITIPNKCVFVCYEKGGYKIEDITKILLEHNDIISESKSKDIYISNEVEYLNDNYEYFVFYTNNTEMSIKKMIINYRNLFQIKSFFKIEHNSNIQLDLNKFFFIDYICSVVGQLFTYHTYNKYGLSEIVDSLKNAMVIKIEQNIYVANKIDKIFSELCDVFNIKIENKYYRYEDLNKLLK